MPLNPKPYTVRRFTRTLVEGVIVESLDSEFTVWGSLQPVRAGELANSPEGFRTTPGRKWKFYSDAGLDLRMGGLQDDGSDGEPDRLLIVNQVRTNRYAYVHALDHDWDHGLIPGRKWLLVEPSTEVGQP